MSLVARNFGKPDGGNLISLPPVLEQFDTTHSIGLVTLRLSFRLVYRTAEILFGVLSSGVFSMFSLFPFSQRFQTCESQRPGEARNYAWEGGKKLKMNNLLIIIL